MDIYSKKKRSEIMSKVRSRNTLPEVSVRRKIHSHGFRFRLHDSKLPGKPDIVLRKYGTAVFVHGCFWHHHGCSKSKLPASNRAFWKRKILSNVERDKKTAIELKCNGWHTLVIWECEVKRDDFIRRFESLQKQRKRRLSIRGRLL